MAEAAAQQRMVAQHKASMSALEGRHEGLLRELHTTRQRQAEADEAARNAAQRERELLLKVRGAMGVAQEQLHSGLDAIQRHLGAPPP